MASIRPTKTLADYMVIAISPVLIIVLVHSVCFFLVDVFYRGQAEGGVRWVLFWFVLAVVLITRIGIEQGDTQAVVYGLMLAGVTWLYLTFVQHNAVFGALLLGIVWFTAHKITTNCTLIDDEADASGQGLMQSLRKLAALSKRGPGSRTPGSQAGSDGRPAASSVAAKPGRPAAPEKKKAKAGAGAAPGIWLIYYSLAALPIFGLGQMLLPADDFAARHRGFVHLFCYLAAALGLLITTSFLGLRRYLRQRYVAMPGKVAVGWIQFGVAGALVVLCACLLLPRPGAGEAWGSLRYQVDYQLRQASQYAARFNPAGRGAGRPGEQTPPGSPPQNPSSPGGQTPGPDQNQSQGTTSAQDQPPGSATKSGAPSGGGGTENRPMPALPPGAGPVFAWVKALFYLALLAGFLWLSYRYRLMIIALARGIWNAIRDFVAKFLGLFRPPPASVAVAPKKIAFPPFKTFKNPFITGGDRIWPAERLIAYSYAALQSWALQTEAPASPQTPREFCRGLAEELPDAAAALEHLAFLYGHVAYGASVPANYDPGQLRLIWDYLALPRKKNRAVLEKAQTDSVA
jgi:hypothetical protein